MPKRHSNSATEESRVYSSVAALLKIRQRAKGFSYLPKKALANLLSGRKRASIRGRGLDFEELRNYRPGDDVRSIDWKVTNRSGRPHVRVYSEEKDRPVVALVDQRQSMFFGSIDKMKSVLGCELAALMGWRTLAVGDRFGAVLFNDQRCEEFRPSRSERSIMALLSRLVSMNRQLLAAPNTTPLAGQLLVALKQAGQLLHRDGLLIMVSDLADWDEAVLTVIRNLSQCNDVLVLHLYDPLEQQPVTAQPMAFSDGSDQLQVDISQQQLSARYQQEYHERLQAIAADLQSLGIPLLRLSAGEDCVEQLRQFSGRPR
ncbi:MAG: hypothetical protein ACI9WS_000871 [Paraglaciecola psychrophila]|jgi:uncharacterized protein (DUF58 family)